MGPRGAPYEDFAPLRRVGAGGVPTLPRVFGEAYFILNISIFSINILYISFTCLVHNVETPSHILHNSAQLYS